MIADSGTVHFQFACHLHWRNKHRAHPMMDACAEQKTWAASDSDNRSMIFAQITWIGKSDRSGHLGRRGLRVVETGEYSGLCTEYIQRLQNINQSVKEIGLDIMHSRLS